MDALIFDFDGVVVDSEPIHLAGFAEVLRGDGIEFTREDYFNRYLGFDDHDCFQAVLRDFGHPPASEERIAEMTAEKSQLVQSMMSESIPPVPGAVELIHLAREGGIPLAICSGALRVEIEQAARKVGVWDCFSVVVSAEDVAAGKPDPEGYIQALAKLAERAGDLDPKKCVVCEDSPAGIQAAKSAGLNVLALATSYPPEKLTSADRVVPNLAGITLADLDPILGPCP